MTVTPEQQGAASHARDIVLDQLPDHIKVQVLKFANDHGIRPDDASWIIVSVIGYVHGLTEALPAKLLAAGEEIQHGIRAQRWAEQKAFVHQMQQQLQQTQSALARSVADSAKDIADAAALRRLWIARLSAWAGATGLASTCFLAGTITAGGFPSWVKQALANPDAARWEKIVAVIFSVPSGYIVFPLLIAACLLFLWDRLALLPGMR